MAASQSLTEGLPPSDKPSFADMVRGTSTTNREPFKEAALHKGEPALLFSAPEVLDLSAPLRFALIGKFAADRPSMEFIRRGFKTIGFKGDFRLGLLDPKHILIRFDLEEDYHRCWLHNTWRFKDHIMKVLKWTPEFSAKEEPPIVPVWVSFNQLPLFLFARSPLFSLGRILGEPLKLDAATLSLSRPSVARICVEIDLRNPLPSRIWIGLGQSGFWQPVSYENLPEYCFDCHSLGHAQPDCGKQISIAPKAKQIWRAKATQPSTSQPHQFDSVPPQPPSDLLVQDPPTVSPPTFLDVPASSSGEDVVHGHATVDEQLGTIHPQCQREILHGSPVHVVDHPADVDHLPQRSSVDAAPFVPLQITVASPVASSGGSPLCLPPIASCLAPIVSASDVLAVETAAAGLGDVPPTTTAEALIDGELCSASSDSDHDHHHSDPTSQPAHSRPRKPYSKRNFGTSAMVTRSSVPSLPLND